MRNAYLALVALGLGMQTASAGPVARLGAVGGYDETAPANRADGLAAGAGYRFGPWTAEVDFSYLQYDGSQGVGGGTTRAGVLLQHEIYAGKCEEGTCPHVDLDLGVGYRWVNWQFDQQGYGPTAAPVNFRGRELELGLSANFLLHLALHYVLFEPQSDTLEVACRSTQGGCTRSTLPSIGNVGVMFEASFVLGGS